VEGDARHPPGGLEMLAGHTNWRIGWPFITLCLSLAMLLNLNGLAVLSLVLQISKMAMRALSCALLARGSWAGRGGTPQERPVSRIVLRTAQWPRCCTSSLNIFQVRLSFDPGQCRYISDLGPWDSCESTGFTELCLWGKSSWVLGHAYHDTMCILQC
jgi:hypothetical protein